MKKIVAVVLFTALFLAGCQQKSPKIIGGERDEHGCLGPAGYQWCPSSGKCQRMWEEYCEEYSGQFQGQPITNFDECIKAGNPVMESYPRQCQANGESFTEEINPAPVAPENTSELPIQE